MYSVKSAYLLFQEAKITRQGEDNAGFWRKNVELKNPS